MLIKDDWPEEELDLIHQLILLLNGFTLIYHMVQRVEDEGGNWVIKLGQKYESACNGSIEQI